MSLELPVEPHQKLCNRERVEAKIVTELRVHGKIADGCARYFSDVLKNPFLELCRHVGE